jgi:DNA-binding NarL/FixJ family response regulator
MDDSAPAAPDHDGAIRVLVVDDHAVVRRGLLAFLDGEADLEVVGDVAGGAAALELLAELDTEGLRPDVVVMDLHMEPVDGIETTRQIRSRYDDVEVVALTSFGEEERVRAALEAGASGYLLKDADADEVAVAIRAAHRGELQLDPAVARYLTSALLAAPRPDARGVLTSRELEVLRLVGAGAANKAIAAELGISERTARTHVSKILGKLGLSSRTQAALWAAREGLVPVAADEDGLAQEPNVQSLKKT